MFTIKDLDDDIKNYISHIDLNFYKLPFIMSEISTYYDRGSSEFFDFENMNATF